MKNKKTVSILVAVVAVCLACTLSVFASETNVIKKYSHGRMFLKSEHTEPLVKEEDKTVFTYQYADAGVLRNLNSFHQEWQMWTLDGVSPAVGEYVVGASDKYDGVITFTATEECDVRIGSSMKIKIDEAQAENCDGAEILVMQQKGNQFAPLWPDTGSFTGYNPKVNGKTILKDVYTHLQKGEKVLFVVRSIGTMTGDTIAVDPTIEIIDKKVAAPTKYEKYPNKKVATLDNTVYVSSGFINDGADNKKGTSSPFTYRYGLNGDYTKFLPCRDDVGGTFIWKFEGDSGAPWIAPWFMSACNQYDGVTTFTAPANGVYQISNNQGKQLAIDINSGNVGDGLSFAIIAENKNGLFYPIYPEAGKWRYQMLNEYEKVDFPDMEFFLKEGEKIHFIAHSKGEERNSVVIFDPKLTLKNTSAKTVSYNYTKWDENIERGVPEGDVVRLCDYFNASSPENGPIKLMSGWNFEYTLLDTYKAEWGGWTTAGGGAAIGLNYLGAISKKEAALCYVAPKSGQVTLESAIPIKLDFPDLSDGARVLVFVRNNNGDRPLWPIDGAWVYQNVVGTEEVDLGKIKVNVLEGDQIFVLCRTYSGTNNDTVRIAPIFSLDTTVTGDIPEAVDRLTSMDDYYISTLPDVKGLKIAKPAGNDGAMGIGKILILSGSVALILTLGGLSVILIRRRKKRGEKQE